MTKSNDGLEPQGKGKWKARITYRDPVTGKKRDTDRVIKDAPTKADALAMRDKIKGDLERHSDGKEWTVSEALDAWLPSQPHNSQRSRKPHATRLRAAFGRKLLSDVDGSALQRFLDALPSSDKTANQYRASILSLYTFARSKGHGCPTPTTSRRSKPLSPAEKLAALKAKRKAAPKALLGEDLRLVFEKLEEREPDLYPMMRTQLLLGCRWCEVSVLQWDHIDWDTGAVLIIQSQARNGELGPPKGGNERDCALGPQGLAFMRGHRARMEQKKYPGWETWCFPRCPEGKRPSAHTNEVWHYEGVRLRVKDVIESCGVEVARVTHSLRHAFVTISAAVQSDAKLDFVGHSSPRINENYMGPAGKAHRAVGYAAQMEEEINGGVFGGANVFKMPKTPKK
jgi:integrase